MVIGRKRKIFKSFLLKGLSCGLRKKRSVKHEKGTVNPCAPRIDFHSGCRVESCVLFWSEKCLVVVLFVATAAPLTKGKCDGFNAERRTDLIGRFWNWMMMMMMMMLYPFEMLFFTLLTKDLIFQVVVDVKVVLEMSWNVSKMVVFFFLEKK